MTKWRGGDMDKQDLRNAICEVEDRARAIRNNMPDLTDSDMAIK